MVAIVMQASTVVRSAMQANGLGQAGGIATHDVRERRVARMFEILRLREGRAQVPC